MKETRELIIDGRRYSARHESSHPATGPASPACEFWGLAPVPGGCRVRVAPGASDLQERAEALLASLPAGTRGGVRS